MNWLGSFDSPVFLKGITMIFSRIIDIDTRRNRATYLLVDGKVMRFGLAIRREKNAHIDRWAFYLGITEEEYNFFVNMPDCDSFSFLGVPSVAISIAPSKAEMLCLEPPARFIGIHFDHDPTNRNWSDASISFEMERFYQTISGMLRHEETA